VGEKEVDGKGGRRVNTVQKMCTHVCINAKMIPIGTIPGMDGGK
jgi:hypothetical protein